MTPRRPGLLVIGCLACLDVLAHQAVGWAETSLPKSNARATASPFLLASGAAPPAGLALGSQGTPVAELQKTLRLLGYFDGDVNGVYRESTAAAVSKFQKAVDIQRALVAQVPAASNAPAQKPAKGLPVWWYGLGGIAAIAAGVTFLRLSGRSSTVSVPPAASASPRLTPPVNHQAATQPAERSPAVGAPPSRGVELADDVDRPVIPDPAAFSSQTAPSHTPVATAELPPSPPIASPLAAGNSTPSQGADNGPTNGGSAPPLAPPAAENGQRPAVPDVALPVNGHQAATTTQVPVPTENRSTPHQPPAASQALTVSTPVSETTRMTKINIVDELMQDLRSPDAIKRHQVIWELSHRGDTRAVQPLVDLLIDSDSKQRSLILSALSEIGTRTLRPMSRALAISLQDDSPDVRKNAIRDLTRVYDMVAQISQLLHKATDDSDREVQETARWALGQLNRIRSVPDDSASLKNSVSPPENLP